MSNRLPCGCTTNPFGKFVGYAWDCIDHPRLTWRDRLAIYPARLRNVIRHCRLTVKWSYQRARRGYADVDVWNANSALCKLISSFVRELRIRGHGIPGSFVDEDGNCLIDEWNAVLQKIEDGFEARLKVYDCEYSDDDFDKLDELFKDGMHLFVQHFDELWD